MTYERQVSGEFVLVPIAEDGSVPEVGRDLPAGIADMCKQTSQMYDHVGYHPPWIGYLAMLGDEIVGGGAFVGPPKEDRVEIAYFTLPEREGQGIAGETARRLVALANASASGVVIFAKTLPSENASTRILRRLGFVQAGIVQDHEIGDAWAWLMS